MNNIKTKKMRAVIYARISSTNQHEESTDAQVKHCYDFAKKNNYHVVETYVDLYQTGTDSNRTEFNRLISDSSLGKFDIVLVHKLDRFARNQGLHFQYERALQNNNVELVSITEQFEKNPSGTFLKSTILSMNQLYSENLSQEVMKTLLYKAEKGLHLGGKPPLGYNVITITEREKRYEINHIEAKAVEMIFQMYSNNYGYDQIIETLNSNGFLTKKGNLFGKNSLHDILKNEKYRGVYFYNKRLSVTKTNDGKTKYNRQYKSEDEIIRIENGMPRIISDELWFSVQEKMQKNKKRNGTHKAKQNYLLSGLIRCSKCNSIMIGNSRMAGREKKTYTTWIPANT